MKPGGRLCRFGGHSHEGSALLLVLFVCLGVAIAIQTLSVVLLCAEKALADESTGRSRAGERDEGLGVVQREMVGSWHEQPWATVVSAPNEVQARVSDLEGGLGWVMRVDVRQRPEVSRMVTSVWAERGRDGIDLPLAALVAKKVVLDPDRVSPWLEVDGPAAGSSSEEPISGATATAYLGEVPEGAAPGEGCLLTESGGEWRLDDGWRLLGQNSTAPGPGVLWISASQGETVRLPEDCGGESVDSPLLVVLSGGGDLDARERGNLHGVVVVDGGSLLLEGTVLHGAAFAAETVTLGTRGCLRYSQPLLRWATDRSMCRVRLVPGSRWEGTE